MVDPFVPMRGTPGIRGRCDAAVARDHGFGCVHQMQGQMHVHVTEIDLPVPLLGHFFRHLLSRCLPTPSSFLRRIFGFFASL
jgi:hypothetical protein